MPFCRLLAFFYQHHVLLAKLFQETIRVSSSFDPDQARRVMQSDLDLHSFLSNLNNAKPEPRLLCRYSLFDFLR